MTRRLQLLFLAALAGVLVAVGLVVTVLGGAPALAGYAVAAVVVLGAGATRARAAAATRRVRHCTCCDGDHTGPVQVV